MIMLLALRASLRQAPDVILLGEMRDYETIKTAMTRCGNRPFGHFHAAPRWVLSIPSTALLIFFPPNQQQQIRVQLAMLLKSVISQQLVPTVSGGIVPAFEVMHVNNAIRNMIREAKAHQIDSVIAGSSAEGMTSMDSSLMDMYKKGVISAENRAKVFLSCRK